MTTRPGFQPERLAAAAGRTIDSSYVGYRMQVCQATAGHRLHQIRPTNRITERQCTGCAYRRSCGPCSAPPPHACLWPRRMPLQSYPLLASTPPAHSAASTTHRVRSTPPRPPHTQWGSSTTQPRAVLLLRRTACIAVPCCSFINALPPVPVLITACLHASPTSPCIILRCCTAQLPLSHNYMHRARTARCAQHPTCTALCLLYDPTSAVLSTACS